MSLRDYYKLNRVRHYYSTSSRTLKILRTEEIDLGTGAGICTSRSSLKHQNVCQTAQAAIREGGAGNLGSGSGLLERSLEVSDGSESLSVYAAVGEKTGQPPGGGYEVYAARPLEVVRRL